MNPIRYSIQKPVTVSVGVILIILFGVISLYSIPIQLTPSIEVTVISVSTNWEGASPQQMESDVVTKQEEMLKGIPNLVKMTSTCRDGGSEITLEFEQGTSKDFALQEVSNRMREVRALPENVDEPVVRARNPQDRDYIAWIVVSCTDPNLDIRTMQDYFQDIIKPELERVNGISEINIIGGWEREMQVLVDPIKLAQRGITYRTLVSKLRAQNNDASGGNLRERKTEHRLRSLGRFERPEQIQNTLLNEPGQPIVRVSDVAPVVQFAYKEPDRVVRSRGKRVLAINAQREIGSNVIQVMDRLKKRLEHVKNNLLPQKAKQMNLNGGFLLEQVYDQTIYIDQAVELVQSNLYVGGTLAVAALLIFLWSFRATLVIALAIPISVVGTFLAMSVMGRNINVISLAGLAFAVGMVVDNAIVVLENIDRHRKMGADPFEAAYKGAKEVWGAVLASTLTTVAVFIPILTIQEEAGQLFRDISLAVCASVLISLIVSVTVIPMISARLLSRRRHDEDQPSTNKQNIVGRLLSRFTANVANAIHWMTSNWIVRPLVVVGLTLVALLGSAWLTPPASYLPTGNRNLIFGILATPPGYSLEKQEELGKRVENIVRPYWEAGAAHRKAEQSNDSEQWITAQTLADALPKVNSFNFATRKIEQIDPVAMDNFFFVVTPDSVFMGGTSVDDLNVKPIQALMNQAKDSLPAVRGFAGQMALFRTGSRGSGSGIELELIGNNLQEVTDAAVQLLQRLRRHKEFPRTSTDPSNFDLPGPEVTARLISARAADVNLTQEDINTSIQVLGDGLIIGDFLDGNDTIDLKIRALNAERGDAMYFQHTPLATPTGRITSIDSIADIRKSTSPQQINRVEEQRAVVIEISLSDALPLEEAMQIIQKDIDDLRTEGVIPPSVRTNLSGVAAKLKEVKNALLGEWTGWNSESYISLFSSRLFLALIVVFLLMAALFESWLYPFVIMFTVPLATVGGFLGLSLVHAFYPEQQLDVLTMLGFIILIGIVVNNAILIVHQTLNLMRGEAIVNIDGKQTTNLDPRRAIAEAVRSRIRPIFMSMLTSVGGMLPLVLMPGAGSELYRGLGSVVVGGLIIATFFTLLLVPLLLSLVFDLKRGLGKLIRIKQTAATTETDPA